MREIIPMGFAQPLSKILPISLFSGTEFIAFEVFDASLSNKIGIFLLNCAG